MFTDINLKPAVSVIPIRLRPCLCHSRTWLARRNPVFLGQPGAPDSGFLAHGSHARGNDTGNSLRSSRCNYVLLRNRSTEV